MSLCLSRGNFIYHHHCSNSNEKLYQCNLITAHQITHATATQLSCHMQNIVIIIRLICGYKLIKTSFKLQF